MANAVEAALQRASVEQREQAQRVIEEARNNIKLVSVRQVGDISSTEAASIAHQAQVIEDAKRVIPFETMRDVEEPSSPSPVVTSQPYYGSNVIELHPQTQETIERIEQGEGNNYLRKNAVDRAMARQQQPMQQEEQQQDLER